MRRGRVVALVVAAGLVGSAAAGVAQAAPAAAPPPVPTLRWADCGAGFQCATARAPLDYAKPRGASISLALIRWPAADRRRRIGSLFVNPGGPGGSGVDEARTGAARRFGGELHQRFDVVGFDPRGVGASAPVRCFASKEEQERFGEGVPSFPLDIRDHVRISVSALDFARRCAARNGELLRHVTTADTARDLDLLRAAVGDKQLTFHGASYGTYLAAVYANMFPSRVRAIVADGALDPAQHASGEDHAAYREFAAGAEHTLDGFATACAAAGQRCAFAASDGPATRRRINALLAVVRAHPVTVPGQRPTLLTYQTLVGWVYQRLSYPSRWPELAAGLAELEPLAHRSAPALARPTARSYDNQAEAAVAIGCTDVSVGHDPAWWWRQARDADRVAPTFGRLDLYQTLPCAPWLARSPERYAGPFDRRTANPVLVIGNTYDPVTPLAGARRMADLLPNSRLLTLDGYGHTSLADPSACVRDAVRRYLLARQLPAKGTVCQPDHVPFDPAFPPPHGDAATRRSVTW